MKKIVLIGVILFAGMGIINAQQKQTESPATQTVDKNAPQPKAVFSKTVHDFGKIKESDEKATTVFTVKNEGKTPLIIQNANASCGCTKPEFTKEPILPGKTGTIAVAYSTIGRVGGFEKQVKIFTNVPDEVYTLTIKGEVTRD